MTNWAVMQTKRKPITRMWCTRSRCLANYILNFIQFGWNIRSCNLPEHVPCNPEWINSWNTLDIDLDVQHLLSNPHLLGILVNTWVGLLKDEVEICLIKIDQARHPVAYVLFKKIVFWHSPTTTIIVTRQQLCFFTTDKRHVRTFKFCDKLGWRLLVFANKPFIII